MKWFDLLYPPRNKDLVPDAGVPADTATTFGGEFRLRSLEQSFLSCRLIDTIAYARGLLVASTVLNILFLASDWRFHGTAQFWIAIPARVLVVLVSLVCAALVTRCESPRSLRLILAGWLMTTGIGVTALVSSHTEVALFVVLLLPMIFYLGVPLPFMWTLAGGAGTSAALLLGYDMRTGASGSTLGLGLGLLTLNCCLVLVVRQSNRLRRREWQATQTARHIAHELSASRETLDKMFSAAPVPMVVTSAADGRILHVNEACSTMFGIAAAMIGQQSFVRYYADPAERERLMKLLQRDGRVSDFETQALCADGVERTVMVTAAPVDLSDGPAVIAGLIDISDRRAVELNLEWLASTDPLTRLPNRLSFFSTARTEMMRARRLDRPLALLMVDLDHFKAVNDTFGHHGGDAALKAFGQLCIARLRDSDIVGRLGGEEFAILLPDMAGEQACHAAEMLRTELTALRLPSPYDAMRLSASIGMTMVLPDDQDLDAAMARADLALYAAKRGGRNRLHCDLAGPPAMPARIVG